MSQEKEAPAKAELIEFKGKPHQLVETPYGTMALPFEAQIKYKTTSACMHKLPLIPLELFYQILSWQKQLARAHQCETHTSLFLIDGKWVAEPFFQQNNHGSMTIDVDYQSEENLERYNELYNKAELGVHATIHNHVNSGAGQSSVDHDDELGLPGPHITLGNMQQKKIDFHGRFSVMSGGEHYFVPMRLSDIVELPIYEDASPGQVELAETLVLTDVPDVEWPKEWDDKFTKQNTYAGGARSNPGFAHGSAVTKKTTTGTTTTSTNSGSQASRKPNVGHDPLVVADIDPATEPWALILGLDATNYVEFKATMNKASGTVNKPISQIMAKHNLSIHEVWKALFALKKLHEIPLDSFAQAAK